MSGRDVLERLAAIDPGARADAARESQSPAAREALARITAGPPPRPRRRWPAVAAACGGAAAAVAGLVLGIALVPGTGDGTGPPASSDPPRNGVQTFPATPEGRRAVQAFLARISGTGPNHRVRPATVRAVFSARTPAGEYTIWRARTVGPRGSATVYSSPRAGASSSVGVEPRLPPAPFVFHTSGGAYPPGNLRVLWGRASPRVDRVLVVLKDGSRGEAIMRNGWWVFSQRFRDPKPVALVGLGGGGEVVVTNRRGIF